MCCMCNWGLDKGGRQMVLSSALKIRSIRKALQIVLQVSTF